MQEAAKVALTASRVQAEQSRRKPQAAALELEQMRAAVEAATAELLLLRAK